MRPATASAAAAPLTDSPLLAVLALVYNSAQVYDPRSSRMLHDETRSSPRRAEDAGANGRLRFARSCEPAFVRRPGQPESLVDHNVDFVDGEHDSARSRTAASPDWLSQIGRGAEAVVDHVGAIPEGEWSLAGVEAAELEGAPGWAMELLGLSGGGRL